MRIDAKKAADFDRGCLARSMRVVPSFRSGVPNGVKLFAIRKDSRRRHALNGEPVTPQGLEALLATKPPRLALTVLRQDAEQRLTVELTW